MEEGELSFRVSCLGHQADGRLLPFGKALWMKMKVRKES